MTEPFDFSACESLLLASVRVLKDKPRLSERFLSLSVQRAVQQLDHLRLLLMRLYEVSLPVVGEGFASLKHVKEFCDGFLDRGVAHAWKSSIRRLGLKDRVAIRGSTFLFRKVLPSTLPPGAVTEYARRMSVPQGDPDPKFLEFVDSELGKMFHFGWDFDSGYAGEVENLTLPTSSCLENGRKDGGVRGWGIDNAFTRFHAFDRCVGSVGYESSDVVGVCTAETAGKTRIVTRAPACSVLVKPFHKVFFKHLTKNKSFLRGEAEPCVLKGFTKREGEVFVSGDYESATDNLNIVISRFILEKVMSRATQIPESVKEASRLTLASWLKVGKSTYPLRRGQLMGQLLSFPLLSLTNYLAFRYLVPRKGVPVLVNGDDIVFRSTAVESDAWFDGVRRAGLTLSLGKTLVQSSWFSVNSTFFHATNSAVRLIPIVRSSSLYPRVECPSALSGRFRTVARGYKGGRRDIVHGESLKLSAHAISASQRSLVCLDIRVSGWAIKRAMAYRRERFYRSFSEPLLPAPKALWRQDCIPPDWVRVRRSTKPDESRFFKEMNDRSWAVHPRVGTTTDYWTSVREGTASISMYWKLLKERVAKCVSMRLYPSKKAAMAACEVPPIRVSSGFEEEGIAQWVRRESLRAPARFVSAGLG